MPNRSPHVALLALAVALFPRCDGDAPPSPTPPAATGSGAVASWRPNVLVVTLDTTRADVLGCYGATHGLTPTLDALAARGVRFADARSPAPVTMPSHASLFTGSWPFQHGVRDNGTFVLGEGATTLAERLHAAGWQTGAFPAAFVVASQFGLAQGFDRYDDLTEATVATGGEDEERKGDVVVDHALAWLATLDRARPFLLWVHFFDPHFPYAPPADLLAAHPFDDDPSRKGNARAKSRHLYQLELASVDRQLARLLAGLAPLGGAEETLIVVVGDHGEGLGDHGEASHATFVYDSTLRVPLLVAQARLPAGKIVAAAVSTVDVTPTLLELVGLPRDGTAGVPLAAAWREEPFARERPLYFENCATWFSSGWAPLYGVVEGRFKTIVGPQVRLFDVVADPAEKRDLAEQHPEIVERARSLLSDYAEQTLAAGRHEADAGELEKLQRLGYVQSSASSRRDGLVPPGWQPKGALTPEQGQENQKRYTQANQLWQQGKRDEGIALLLELTRDEPQNAHYAEIAAALLHERGRAAEALPLAERAIELAESVGNRTTHAACLFSLGRSDDALASLKASVERFGKLPAPRLQYAKALLDHGRAGEVAALLEPLLESLPADSPLRAQANALLERARAGGR